MNVKPYVIVVTLCVTLYIAFKQLGVDIGLTPLPIVFVCVFVLYYIV